MVGIWVNKEKKGKAKRMGNKWREEKHRGRKKMKRPIYLEMRLWEGEWKRQVWRSRLEPVCVGPRMPY